MVNEWWFKIYRAILIVNFVNMNISLNLLKKYVDLSGISIDDIGDALMEHVFEIDDIIDKRTT